MIQGHTMKGKADAVWAYLVSANNLATTCRVYEVNPEQLRAYANDDDVLNYIAGRRPVSYSDLIEFREKRLSKDRISEELVFD